MKHFIKSPLRYPGGKSRAIVFLKQFIPDDFGEYREPFFGGGSMGFFIAQRYKNIKLVANDKNFELYCFWDNLKNNASFLIEQISNIKDRATEGRILYKEILERRNDNLKNIERAIDFFILNRITFSGVVDSGGYSEKSFLGRFTYSSIERLKLASSVIENFDIYNVEANELILKDGKNVFIFLDPPYFGTTKSKLYGKKGSLHINFNHNLLYQALKETTHRFLLTYDNSDFIRELYKDFYQLEWDLQYGMNNYKQSFSSRGKELIISNFEINKNLF